MRKQRSERKARQRLKGDLASPIERHDRPSAKAAKQLGATEEQVKPLTPPMARSDEQPGDPDRGLESDQGLDPADELTPG